MSTTEVEDRVKPRIIRDKAFAKRLTVACEGNPHCPTEQYRGKQKWVYDGLESEFGVRVSSEAVRKWFAGESRPRPKIMSYLARLLEVDEGWLSLGLKPDLTPVEKKVRNAVANGAVNLVAGIIQMAGGTISFTESGILAIIKGKALNIEVLLPLDLGNDHYRVSTPDRLDDTNFLVVFEEDRFGYILVNLSADVIRDAGERRGDFWDVIIEQRGDKWRVGSHQVRQLERITDMLGYAPQPPPK